MMSCLFLGCASEVGHLFENGVGHILENKVGIFLENLGLMVGRFPENSQLLLTKVYRLVKPRISQ
jgi:hypothetical protein